MSMTPEIRTVVIGTSLTAVSDEVVKAGLQVARAAGARILLVHAFQVPVSYAAYGGGAPYTPDLLLADTLRAEHELVEQRLTDQIGRLGIHSDELLGRRIESGPPHRVITEAAEKAEADLIVVGATESVGLAKMFGSTADRVVRKATRPVLMIRDRLELPWQRILLPVDLSPLSAVAFRHGLALLDQIAPELVVQLEAFYVMTGFDRGILEPQGDPDLSESEAVRELQRFVADNSFRSRHRVYTRLAHGEIAQAIRNRCEDWEADLIVLGTHGRGGFERLLLGSVASDLIRRSSASVLIIPAGLEVRESRPLKVQEALVALGTA
jgi:nucleotide-binding universal stress UspA family protein